MIMASKFYILHYHHLDTERKFKILSFVFQEIRISMAEMQELNFKDAFGCDTSCEAGTGKSDFRSMKIFVQTCMQSFTRSSPNCKQQHSVKLFSFFLFHFPDKDLPN